MKKLFTTILLTMVAVTTWAYDVEVDGIYYNLNTTDKTAEVTYETTNYNSYSGSVTIPESIGSGGVTYSVTSIGYEAFYKCTGLTSVTIPNSVTSIGSYAFYKCSGLTSVTIGNSVTSIGKKAFYYCTGLTSVNITDIAAWCNISFGDDDSNPLVYAEHLYLNGDEIKDLVIPNSVTSIGDGAFSGCTGLTSVTIPNSVTSIGNGAFRACLGLTSVTIPNSVTSIGNYAFDYCTGLTSVTIPNSVTSIGDGAFSYCSGLTSVTIGNSVTSIGEKAFYDCSGLKSVNITDLAAWCNISFYYAMSNPLFYAKHLYLNGDEIKDLVIPNSVTSIGVCAFYGWYSLTSVTIPNSVTSIGEYAFSDCSGLKSVNITDIAAWCSISFDESTSNPLYYAQHLYLNGDEIKDLVIPNSVTSIGDWAFSGWSGLTSVTIGNSVTSIGGYAFYSCKNIETVTCYAEKVPSMGSDVFKDSNVDYATLKVPYASVDLYKAADQWKDFGTIIGIEGGGTAEKCATPTIRLRDGKIVATSETERATCTVTKEVKTVDDGYTLVVTAYATADGYAQSETATVTYPLSLGERGDVNGDGKVTISDLALLIDKKPREDGTVTTYKEVEYISGTGDNGGAGTDLQYSASSNLSSECDFMIDNYTDNFVNALYGINNTGSYDFTYGNIYYTKRFAFDTDNLSYSTLGDILTTNQKYTVKVTSTGSSGTCYIYKYGEEPAIYTKTRNATFENSNKHFGLMCWFQDSDTPDSFFAGKVYHFKLYDSGTLVRDCVPVKSSDGVYGFYDKVNAVFYKSIGIGEFSGGEYIDGGQIFY